MAVSGRKLSDFQGSASLASAEDFDHSCEPCLTIGQHVESHGFCVDCQEYLCKNCFDCHKRTKASRNHQLLDKDNVGKQVFSSEDSDECTEKCLVHKKEIIKFYCAKHKSLGCNDCMTIGHRTCKIDYIPDKCTGIGNSEEYSLIMKKLNEKMKETEHILKNAEARDKQIDKCHSGIMKEILNFRKEINDRLDVLQQKIQKNADEKKSNDKKLVQMVLDECTSISTDIKQHQSTLQANKTSRQNGQLYISIKRAECKLNADEVKKADEILAKTNLQYSFERNADLEMLLKHDLFGKLNISASLPIQVKKKTCDNLTHKEDINVKAKSDSYSCYITGCAALSCNTLVLADNGNKKLKVVSVQSKAVIEEKTLDSKPWGIAAMPHDQIAVTMPLKREILLMTAASKLSAVKTIPVEGPCKGLTYHQDHLYVVCQDPNSVLVLDTQGNVQNTISLKHDMFTSPGYIVVSEDSRYIYISDYGSNCIVSITLQGNVSAVYKNQDLYGPWGMLMLDDGSLLVCSYANNTIHHITGDLKQGQVIIEHVQSPFSMCYSHRLSEVYVGQDGNQLKVISVK